MNASYPIQSPARDGLDTAADRLIWGTLLFNWALAFINAQVKGISQPYVVICEALFMATSLFIIARRGLHKDQLGLLCAFALYLVFTLLRFMYAQGVAPKPVRDVAIIFVFLGLGLAYRCEPYRLVYRISVVVAVIGLLEILFPMTYAKLFNIKAYYISTRGFSESDFWNSDSDMFISGTRPGARFFLSFTNLPRASSIFLEPVSLGNFIVVSLAVLLAGWRTLPAKMKAQWSAILVVILLISDSRYGFACSLILIGFRMFFYRFPQQFAFLIFAAIVGAAWSMIHVLHISRAEDNFTGRIFYTFQSLGSLDISGLLGLRLALVDRFADSGLTYFIVCQSVVSLILLLLYYSIAIAGNSVQSRFLKNAVMIAFGLNLLISNSIFSIKVAALMWFCVGAFVSARAYALADGAVPEPPLLTQAV